MINILVVSDTHKYSRKLDEVLSKQLALEEKFRPKYLIHLGDGIEDIEKCKLSERFCVLSVKGNCDNIFFSDSVPTEREAELCGHKLLLMHGHTHGVKCGVSEAVAYAAECGADVLMYGHTHAPVSYTLERGKNVGGIVLQKPLVVFNPGSLGYEDSFGTVAISESGIFCSHGSLK